MVDGPNFRIHLISMRHFYGVEFLNKSEKSFIIFHWLFQPAEEFLNKIDKTCKNTILQHGYEKFEKNNKLLPLEISHSFR